jgi:hypothetical protein
MERIGGEIERELARGGARDALPLGAVTRSWRAAVGDAVARNAWPARIGKDGTLHVNASSSTWACELDRLAPEIELSLRASLGENAPTRLRFTVGPVPEPDPDDGDARASAPLRPTPEATAEAADAAAAIEDPDLRSLVERAARASLSRRSSDRAF